MESKSIKYELKCKIEDKQIKLNALIEEKNFNLSDSEIIKLSKQLDELLIIYSKCVGDLR